MGRLYAGILGPVALVVVVARGLLHADAERALLAAPWALFLFAVIGYVVGFIAERTIIEAVEVRFHTQLRASQTDESDKVKTMHHPSGGVART